MSEIGARVYGEVEWPSQLRMAEILRASGLRIHVGRFSIRIDDCEHFVFQEYGGDLGDPVIDADAESRESMLVDAALVSNALARGNVRHRFEVMDDNDQEIAYLHHDWPREDPP